ncbi:MAG: FHA domain-containing protein [Planctomycetota bacterium]|jgi:predicted component of type VI protein secretion system|nr:FHA domain-containing protein [Planctomycetota bacterium]
MNFRLLIHDGTPRQMPLNDGTITLGRSRSCSVQLEDPILSRQHCALTIDAGRLVVADLGSSNGTYVGGERVDVRDVVVGEVIELGSVCLFALETSGDLPAMNCDGLRNQDRISELVAMASVESEELPRAAEELHRSAQRSSHLLAEIAADHLVDELVTLLIRSHPSRRNAFARALDRMIGEKLLESCVDREQLKETARKIVRDEIAAADLEDLEAN